MPLLTNFKNTPPILRHAYDLVTPVSAFLDILVLFMPASAFLLTSRQLLAISFSPIITHDQVYLPVLLY